MALEKIRPGVVDDTQNFVFNNVTATGNLTASNANLGNLATANYVTGTLTTSAQPNITSIGTLGNLIVTSNVSAGNILTNNLLYANGSPWQFGGTGANAAGSNTQVQFNDSNSFGASTNFTFDKTTNTLSVTNFVGGGSGLSNLTGSNISGQVPNALIAGTVYTAAQPNITSVGTLSSLDITGNLTSGNANLGNLVIANFFSGAGNQLSNIQGSNVTGQVSYAAVANSVAGANVSGAVTYAATANAVAGSNVMGQVANATVASTVYTAAQPNITSVGTLSTLTVSGNISSGNANLGNLVVANFFQGNGSLLTGIAATDANFANYAGNVTVAAQSNITSLGNLVGLTVSNSSGIVDFSNTANVTLGNVSNLRISGGTANYVLRTDGAGNLSWVAQAPAPTSNSVITVDTFTANGSQTVFTLSATPLSINYTLLNIDGVSQLKEAYSLSGANITLDSAPVNGSIVEATTFTLNEPAVARVLANFNVRSYTGNGIQTEFEVSSGLYDSGVIVTENGIVQFPGNDYTISGTALTFNTAPAQDVQIQIREIAFTDIWQEVTAATYQAVKGQKLFVDCSASAVTVVLPSVPAMGDEVTIVDAMGNAAINNITVSRNGSNITGVAEDLTIDINDAAITLAYYNATRGWLVISK